MRDAAIRLVMENPVKLARLCGLDRLNERIHGPWLREMIAGDGDLTLLAHRGSYKTTCLAFSMAAMMLLFPRRNLIFMRKTDEDVAEIIRQVKKLLRSEALQHLSALIYGSPVEVLKTDMFSAQLNCYDPMRGAVQLLGMGIGGSLTGKHADFIFTDDIVNLADRMSSAERERTRSVYQELQNIRNPACEGFPGGRIINTGTPWHPQDAISLMPNVRRCDCYHTGLLSERELRRLQRSMSPSLFAANYELRHIAEEGALFPTRPPEGADITLLRDGLAHVDAAYGGEDYTALTCGKLVGDTLFLYGRLWRRHIDGVMDEIVAECDRLLCGPILCETNGDKGYVARELRARGAMVRPYAEVMNKQVKIATHLRKWWDKVWFIEGTDRPYIDQILDYSDRAAHDDAADSAASLARALAKMHRSCDPFQERGMRYF